MAEPPRFIQPLDCTLGETCYIQNYVDTLAAEGRIADYACGTLSYDGHKGTDFALRTRAEMEAGVTVLAAAAGVVRGTRDEMPDTGLTAETEANIQTRECGNGLVIDHGDGWVSQYCHMKLGSISVTKGQSVSAGDPLGQVGLSGRTEFPHLHFTVRQRERVIDPFDPFEAATCGAADETLWAEPPAYQAGGLIGIGFASAVPEFSAVKAGTAHAATLRPEAPALVLWGYTFGTREDDIIRLEIDGPEGFRFAHDSRLEKTQALGFRAAGKKLTQSVWPQGTYQGQVTLIRKGQELGREAITLSIAP
ncbi:M23 family metallopeptidase [Lentibacter sp. XHP0401]|uniref:M23 family metallopeptidase n=1 Tax=Lentibacter sp. XHP0401 TaxID=2984334 RepID=UPI0021E75A87|nr:M23 family metallopeptidase [Lentibacter sp. XHP0401]MCV2894136.1 M23 family metallopeptidase [Lentibacter sp. XHP0401]